MDLFDVFNTVLSFISQNFELVFTINIALIASFVVLLVALRITYMAQDNVLRIFWNRVLMAVILAGIIFCCFIMYQVLLKGHKRTAKPLSYSNLTEDLSWVHAKENIYYINDNNLYSITSDGKQTKTVYRSSAPIREYHFSADGKHILIVTQESLVLLKRETLEAQEIDRLTTSGVQQNIKGAISGVSWAPDSQHFCYELSRWSQFASQDLVYVYNLRTGERRSIKSPLKRVSSLYWDTKSKYLYYLQYVPQESVFDTYKQKVKVYRVEGDSLAVSHFTDVLLDYHHKPDLEKLRISSVDLYLDSRNLSFRTPPSIENLTAPDGDYLIVDELNYLYYVQPKGLMYHWFKRPKRQRLFKIPYLTSDTDKKKLSFDVQEPVIGEIRWLARSPYALLEHKKWGILILDPKNKKVGLLTQVQGHTFGWYRP